MDFSLTEEQIQVRDMVREFAHREVAPYIQEWDAKGEFHRDVLTRMGELGILGLPIPEQYGGLGLDYVSFALACDELEYVDTFLRVVMSVHAGLNSLALLQWANEEQKQRWLVPQAQGAKLATFGLTEPNAGSDAGSIESTVVRDGDHYILNGAKMWISLADVADHFLVFASIDRSKKHHGLCAFVLERGMEGFTTGTIKGKLGVRAGNTGELAFNNVRVPVENRVGAEGDGFRFAMAGLDGGRLNIGACSLGGAQRGLDEAIGYVKERQQFGQPIADFQNTQFKLAEVKTEVTVARTFYDHCTNEHVAGRLTPVLASMAKYWLTDLQNKVVDDCLQLFGGYGYMNEFPIARMYRDARVQRIYGGTNEIMKLLIARSL